jgi:hypothetical protein
MEIESISSSYRLAVQCCSLVIVSFHRGFGEKLSSSYNPLSPRERERERERERVGCWRVSFDSRLISWRATRCSCCGAPDRVSLDSREFLHLGLSVSFRWCTHSITSIWAVVAAQLTDMYASCRTTCFWLWTHFCLVFVVSKCAYTLFVWWYDFVCCAFSRSVFHEINVSYILLFLFCLEMPPELLRLL